MLYAAGMEQGDVDIGLENAGAYLGDTFGPLMRVIWAVGLLAAGGYSRPAWLGPTKHLPDSAGAQWLTASLTVNAMPAVHSSNHLQQG
jgi:hypothetical protein